MEIPYETTPRKDTGLYNSKLAIWLFLASEVMLFGGLFSGYVFLRIGVRDGFDVPWPWGVNVHKSFILLGFINTIILILSSVFVVFGWVALKERKWRKFQMYIFATVACAAVFMGFKAVEYRSKLTQHHDIRLHDGSLMEGKMLNNSFNVPFTVDKVEFDIAGAAPGFIYDFKGEFPTMTVTWQEYVSFSEYKRLETKAPEQVKKKEETDAIAAGIQEAFNAGLEGTRTKVLYTKSQEINSINEFKSWFVKARTTKKIELADERKRLRKEKAADLKAQIEQVENPAPVLVKVPLGAELVSSKPFDLNARFRRVKPIIWGDKGKADKLIYIDNSTLHGKGGDDSIEFEPHYVDMQLVPLSKQKDSEVWSILGDDHAKKMWEKNREKAYDEVEEYYKDREIPEKQLRGYFINIQSIHDKEKEPSFMAKFWKEWNSATGFGQKKHKDDGHSKDGHDKAHAKEDGHEKGHDDHAAGKDGAHDDHHLVIKIPRDKIAFMHSHGPRNSNYYAIYFTITALHGLHVIGGALVLLYFAVFGKKLYKKNPEHLANRVEVGGLFWHFVDLVWIFLFPLMYLL